MRLTKALGVDFCPICNCDIPYHVIKGYEDTVIENDKENKLREGQLDYGYVYKLIGLACNGKVQFKIWNYDRLQNGEHWVRRNV